MKTPLAALLSLAVLAAAGCREQPPPVYTLHLTLTGALVLVRSPWSNPKTIWVLFPNEETPWSKGVTEDNGDPRQECIPPHYAVMSIPGRHLQAKAADEHYFLSLARTRLSIEADDPAPLTLSHAELLGHIPDFLPKYAQVRGGALADEPDSTLASRLVITGGSVSVTHTISDKQGQPIKYTFHGGPGHTTQQFLGETIEVSVSSATLPQLKIEREVPHSKEWTTFLPKFRPVFSNCQWVVNLTLFDSPLDIILGKEYTDPPGTVIPHFAYSYLETTMDDKYRGPFPVPHWDNPPPTAGGHPYCTIGELQEPYTAPATRNAHR